MGEVNQKTSELASLILQAMHQNDSYSAIEMLERQEPQLAAVVHAVVLCGLHWPRYGITGGT